MTTINALAIDCEARGLDWFDPEHRAFMVSWANDEGAHCAWVNDDAGIERFRHALDEADTVIAHNLPYDTHQIREALGIDITAGKRIHDTHILSRVLFPENNRQGRGGHSLKNLSKVHLRADADGAEKAIEEAAKAIGLRTLKQTGAYYEVARAYPEMMERYAIDDARFPYDLAEKFLPELNGLAPIYELEMKVMPILLRAEERGVKTDQAAVLRLKRQYEAEQRELHTYLEKELGTKALGGEGSEEALIGALASIGVPLLKKTPSGKVATDKFTLQKFEQDFPQVKALLELRRVERFLTTYIAAVQGRDVVHTNFNQCGAWTGRMSANRPNMQNWPQRAGKEVRAVFVPRDGYAFVVCDYDQIETRLLAYYLNDRDFSKLIDDGYDAHAYVAAQIWPEVGGYDYFVKGAPGEVGEKSRKTARHTEFAIVYGAGAPRVAAMNGMEIAAARALVSQIKSSLPGYHKLVRRVRQKVESVGYVNTIMGRRNPVGRDKAYVGVNALIQGSAADIMKQGLVNVDEAVRPLGGTPLLVVHDEVVVEVPIENADAALQATEQAMRAAYDLFPRLGVSGSVVTTSYADA